MTQEWYKSERDFKRFLKLEKHLADNSVEAYLRDVRHLSRFAEENRLAPEQVGLEDLQRLIKELNGTDIALSTQSRLISGWRTFYKMLQVEGVVEDNPAELLEMPRTSRHLPDVLTNDDIDRIEATFDLSNPSQARNKVIIEVLYGCGLRVSELTGLRLADVYKEEECLLVTGKGSKQRWVPINRQALRQLDNYIFAIRSHITPKKGEENYVFLNTRGTHLSRIYVFKFIQEAVAQAGVNKKVSPHSFRHSFATELVQNGADLRAVQEMLGHASITTTEIYTHLSRQYLRETIESYHPHYKKR